MSANIYISRKKTSLPLPAEIVKWLCCLGWVIPLLGMLSADDFAGNQRVMWLFWICGICFAVWLSLWIYERRKRAAAAPETDTLNMQAEQLLRQTRETLGIPDSAIDLDALAELFTVKNGKPKHKSFHGFAAYLNLDLYAYVQDGSLFLANTQAVWEIPLSALRSIVRMKKRFDFVDWNKQEPYNSKTYQPYKITVNQFGQYFARCYQVQITDAKGEFYLLIPEYDGAAFMELTGMRPEETA